MPYPSLRRMWEPERMSSISWSPGSPDSTTLPVRGRASQVLPGTLVLDADIGFTSRDLGCFEVSRLSDKARHGSLQRRGLLDPQGPGRCRDHHCARPWARHEAGNLAVASCGGRVGVDHARPASRAKPPVGGGGEEAHVAFTLTLVVLWA